MRMPETTTIAAGGGAKCFPVGWNVAAKPCTSCKASTAVLFCREDAAFLCVTCDEKIHRHRRHERVWMCEVCEQAPASVTCKADAAALCVACDIDIHSANPLARRHERFPVVPFYESTAGPYQIPSSGAGNIEVKDSVKNEDNIRFGISSEEIKFPCDAPPAAMKSFDLLFSDADKLLDLDFSIPTDGGIQTGFHDSVNDSVVPVQPAAPAPPQIVDCHSPGIPFEIDFTRSSIKSYNQKGFPAQSHSHSVSSTSIDAGVAPEANSMSDVSYPFVLQAHGGVESNGSQQATPLSKADREARVLRYREKRKIRKFEKTIRYASRKAYAETRPRIKGRFAKQTESPELEADRWLFTAVSGVSSNSCYDGEIDYGVVPSF